MSDPAAPTAESLRQGRCVPCEGGVPKLSGAEIAQRIAVLDGWEARKDGEIDVIAKSWNAGDFVTALSFFNQVGELAEAEDHHPNLHLTGYRHAEVELSTHAIGGLSENDFILAAKIDALEAPGSE
ncbi:MAG: 4a-hydroxytetrahydrobiopterin dehydratase [Planctomycetota bacterium]